MDVHILEINFRSRLMKLLLNTFTNSKLSHCAPENQTLNRLKTAIVNQSTPVNIVIATD